MSIAGSTRAEEIAAEVFRKAGWRVRRDSAGGDPRADLVIETGDQRWVAEVKGAPEGRRDRLIPLLAQAILEAQARSRRFSQPVVPLAIVTAPRVPGPVAERLMQFAGQYAPDVGVGVIDGEGFRSFAGQGLERLNAERPRPVVRAFATRQRLPDLFSDLNQWMLKILVGQHLREGPRVIDIPRVQVRNAPHLAEVARVSVMSASRFVNQLANQGFLDEAAEGLQLVRIGELLDLWAAANRQTDSEVPARWIVRKGPQQLKSALRDYASAHVPAAGRRPRRAVHKPDPPRCCLGLFAAADALGLGFVQGAPQHIYLERVTLDSLNRLGLRVDLTGPPADVVIRIPAYRETVFRGSVVQEGVRVSDVLQVWLDVSSHPARGREQAREIRRRVLAPLLGK